MSETQPQKPAPLADEVAPSSQVPATVAPTPAEHGGVLGFAGQLLQVLRFYSRLPLPVMPFETAPHAPPDMTTAPVAVAVAGALLGALAGLVLIAASALGLPPLLAALLALAALVIVTGAMHEDALADSADGLWGGATPMRRLEIMRDSRVGSYGVVALVLSLGLRVIALGALVEHLGAIGALLALVAIAATSRVAGLLPLALLTAARTDGAAASVAVPTPRAMLIGGATATAITLAAVIPIGFALAGLLAIAIAFIAAYAVCRIAQAKIGGYTGDIAGAAQHAAEMAMLLVLVAAAAGPG